MSRHALVDGNNVATAAYKVKGELRTSKGQYTGMVLTTLDMIRTLLDRRQDISQVIFAWDSSPTWRHSFYPEYKANRRNKVVDPATDYDYPGQKRSLQVVLSFFGIPQVEASLQEADDIAGAWMKSTNHQVTFVSNDKDWLQVLQNPMHDVYCPKDKTTRTMEDFYAETLCHTVKEFCEMKGITGEKGDNIPGINGVGPVKALAYLRGTMKPGPTKDAIEAWMADEEGFCRSLTLFQLGINPIKSSVVTTTPPNFNEQEIRRILTEFESRKWMDNFDKYIDPFRRLDEWSKANQTILIPETAGTLT